MKKRGSSFIPFGSGFRTRRESLRGQKARRPIGIVLPLALIIALSLLSPRLEAQQFNSDNYWTAPHGVFTFVATYGQNYSMMMGVAALFPNWEFNIGQYLYKKDIETGTTDHFSTTVYLKHMFYENAAKTGGWAVMGGTGIYPAYLQAGTVTQSFKSYWICAPVTFPFFDNTLSWDIMPGAAVNLNYGSEKDTAWSFTYSSRLAVYKIIPHSCLVGEVFGAEGKGGSKPQFKVGVRWESEHVVVAGTFGAAFDGSQGAGFEIGVMLFSPPFLKL